jgi:hypothetical protein
MPIEDTVGVVFRRHLTSADVYATNRAARRLARVGSLFKKRQTR